MLEVKDDLEQTQGSTSLGRCSVVDGAVVTGDTSRREISPSCTSF